MFYILTILVVGSVAWVLATRGKLLAASALEVELRTGRFPRIDALTERVLCAAVAILVVSGLFIAGGITGFVLMIHVFGGAIFAVALAVMVVLRAEAFSGPCCTEGCSIGLCVERMFFWALAATGLCMILTAVLAMMPLLGTEGQIGIAAIHEYISILATASGLGYGFFAIKRCRAAAPPF